MNQLSIYRDLQRVGIKIRNSQGDLLSWAAILKQIEELVDAAQH